jgi:hypothetical protein
MRCLAKSPVQRPTSAAVLFHLLDECDPVKDWSHDKATAWWRDFFPESPSSWIGDEAKTQVLSPARN